MNQLNYAAPSSNLFLFPSFGQLYALTQFSQIFFGPVMTLIVPVSYMSWNMRRGNSAHGVGREEAG